MKKHKVLFVIESLGGGGAEKVLMTLLRHLDYDKFEVGLLSIVDTGVHKDSIQPQVKYYSALSPSGQRGLWYRLKYKLVHNLLPMSVVHRWIVPKGYDTEVAFVEGFATKLVAAAPSSTRRIAWVHIDLLLFPWTIKAGVFSDIKSEQKAYARFDRVIAVSDDVSENFYNRYGIRPITVYNPIDSDDILKKSQDVTYTPKSDGAVRFVTVGRLTKQKGYGRLIEVVDRLIHEGIECDLTIVGIGELEPFLEDEIMKRGLCDYVHLTGYLRNPYPLMKSSDAFVCSSVQEGFSLVVAESMILGLPIVSTKCSGPRELLDNGKFGLLVDNSANGLYEGMKALAVDAELRERMANKSRERAALFSLEDVVGKVEQILLCKE